MYDASYWDLRWKQGETGWDLRQPSPALLHYTAQLSQKNIRILIPGAGSAHEVEALLQDGFTHITVIDIADTPLQILRSQFHQNPYLQIITGDFFEHSGTYDLILEQTFFCALDPSLRPAYAAKMHQLLAPQGLLAGLLFNTHFTSSPPFGGSEKEYRNLFEPYFHIRRMEPCSLSIPPRAGTELWVELANRKL